MDNIRAVIFDLDGVLVFTDKYHYQAWKKIADDMGAYFDEKINDRLRGVSRMESLDIILEHCTRKPLANEKEIIAEEKNSIYRELLKTMSPADVSESIRNTLYSLKMRGYQLAIGSSSKNAKFILEKVGLIDMFDAISDGTNITKSKPDPEVFLRAADFLDRSPETCAVIEDALAGIEAAKSAGMLAIGIGESVEKNIPDYKISSFVEILDILPAILQDNS